MCHLLTLVRRLTLTGILLFPPLVYAEVPHNRAIAIIRVYNPTKCGEPSIVEIPVGDLATPSLVNWENVHLRYKGEALPFALREGKAHWKADLRAPIKKPRAEDLLVFTIRVPSEQWSEVELVTGLSKPQAALIRRGGSMVISYPNMKVVIGEQTGLLTGLEAYGESILSQPLGLKCFEVGEGIVKHEGGMASGYHRPAVAVEKMKELPPPYAKLVSWSSAEALTEINFVLQPENGPVVGLTYRIYPNNQIEIVSDERPWQGRSPWLDCGLEYRFALTGTKEELPGFQSHFPYYGFKDYAASVMSVGRLHRGTKTLAFEMGEESINGRFWRRRLAIYPETEWVQRDGLLQLLDEGLVVNVLPMSSQPLSEKLQVAYSEEVKATGDLLVERLNKAGIQATAVIQPGKKPQPAITLSVVSDPARLGIEGDGFCVRPLLSTKGIEVIAGTKFGLFKGTSDLIRQIKRSEGAATVPLVAGNPVVDLRAGGFGGGPFEVDFPYGSEVEWERAFSGMIASGMNVMTACGMWSNWKMPVSFKYMPELQSDSSSEHDEVSGADFSQTAQHREHALRLLKFLHDRGVKVWLWIPVGAIPTTFQKKFPEAMVPGSSKVPRFLHPKYRQYLEAYFKELLEVYSVDGFVLIRDDNGGVDDTEEFKSYIAQSRTKSPVWEQHRFLYSMLRSQGFKGEIAVYPYFDVYEPRLESLLPADLLVVGHGSGMGVLTRHYETVAPMGDTWLDNPYAGAFRLPTSSRMKRLLADRGSYWLGGAYCGTELPWAAIGYFGWQPTASVNTFRYDFGEKTFGDKSALDFVHFANAYEHLWEIMSVWLLPHQWVGTPETERVEVVQQGHRWLAAYREQLNRLKEGADQKAHEKWFAHVGLYDTFFDYHLRRSELFVKMQDLVVTNRQTVTNGGSLPEPLRQQLIAMNDEIYKLARRYDDQAAKVPGDMMAQTRALKMTLPFKEWVGGYDRSLDDVLQVKQFDGRLRVLPSRLTPGQPFELEIELQNDGCIPWIQGVGHEIELQGETKRLGLPDQWNYEGHPMVFGDRRVVTLRGVAPEQPGKAQIKINFVSQFRDRYAFLTQTVHLSWP